MKKGKEEEHIYKNQDGSEFVFKGAVKPLNEMIKDLKKLEQDIINKKTEEESDSKEGNGGTATAAAAGLAGLKLKPKPPTPAQIEKERKRRKLR